LKLNEIAKIWRGGCIIRADFLNEIYKAYSDNSSLEHLLLDNGIRPLINSHVDEARELVTYLIGAGLSIPAYASAISYFDAIRSDRMPTNLVQAQRDYFGAHTYELIDKEGAFHTIWKKDNQL
jgi:6-phosphogluconate dehydrogenase